MIAQKRADFRTRHEQIRIGNHRLNALIGGGAGAMGACYTAGVYRLTREVRFAVNASADPRGSNGYAGVPPLAGFGHYFALRLTLSGALDPATAYLTNIKRIDAAVRERAVPAVADAVRSGKPPAPAEVVSRLHERLRDGWSPLKVESLELSLSPFLCYSARTTELPMVRLSQKFEFSATHRLHNPGLSDAENKSTYGKCNNPHGHGHNYEVQVTLAGDPGSNGVLADVPAFERIVASEVIDRFDHKNLNVELPEFRDLIPSVENISRVIYSLLKPRFADAGAKLAAVTVWETPKTWCEYSE